jgi:hypothetical protein
MSKPLYVCVTCAQDFTRGSDANRHNSIHHLAQAKIVGFLEYLIGRANGTLPPPSEKPPRLSTKNRKKKKILDCKDSDEQKNARNRFIFLQDATATTTTPHNPPSMIDFWPENENYIINQPTRYGLKINPSLHGPGISSCCCEDRIRKANNRLYELEVLLCPFADPGYIKNLIESIVRHCNEFGDYDYVEECFKNHQKGVVDGRWHWYPNKRM